MNCEILIRIAFTSVFAIALLSYMSDNRYLPARFSHIEDAIDKFVAPAKWLCVVSFLSVSLIFIWS